MARPKRLPEVLTDNEQVRLLEQPNPKCKTGLRNLCMIRIMLNIGLRASEVIFLKVKDVEWMSGKVYVRQGKGNKDRVLMVRRRRS
jgi:integrase/recombinase XerD